MKKKIIVSMVSLFASFFLFKGNLSAADLPIISFDLPVIEVENNLTKGTVIAANIMSEFEEIDEYADFAIANVKSYVNVRKGPGTEYDIVGKIYNGAVAQIIETAGENEEWFHVTSGSVEGYIKAEYFLYGQDAVDVIDDYITRYAQVTATRLNVRQKADVNSKRIGYIDNQEKVKILEDLGEWLKVQYTENETGYIAAKYVTRTEEFIYAKSLEEEAREIAEQKKKEQRKKESESKTKENTTVVEVNNSSYENTTDLRKAIIDYAMQYLGNKYVSGGQSLETGTDCSGFTSLIYAHFGYSLSRTTTGQYKDNGRSISMSDIQPGDVICFGDGKCTHVALYIGNNQIIHSANSKKGVIISKTSFMNIVGVKNIID